MNKITVGKFILAGLLCCTTARAQMPVPPQQNAPWKHEDDAFSRAVATLFEQQGLADPRGLPYCEIVIPTENTWNGYPATTTHGWVLPADESKERFAIAWNGLVYPLIRVESSADLREDWAPDAHLKVTSYSESYALFSEGVSVSYGSPSDLKIAILLRLGETEIVERLRKAGKPQPQSSDPYLSLVRDWAWFAFARAVRAHERGDNELALNSALLLTRIQPLIEAEAKRRGIEQEKNSDGISLERKKSHLPFLDQLPELLADFKRRANGPKFSREPLGDKASIAELIDDLQNVSATQWHKSNKDLTRDSRVQALIRRGDVAVEPLLDALKNDDRLTRVLLSGGGAFSRQYRLLPVSAAINAALTEILQVKFESYNEKGEPLSRQQIRDYWAKVRP